MPPIGKESKIIEESEALKPKGLTQQLTMEAKPLILPRNKPCWGMRSKQFLFLSNIYIDCLKSEAIGRVEEQLAGKRGFYLKKKTTIRHRKEAIKA